MLEPIFILLSYLLGAVPFGYIIYFLSERRDIRTEGSGNIGATNVLRTKGKAAGLATLVLDVLKGAAPILIGSHLFDNPVIPLAGGTAAVLGHMFPVYLKFRGGKGVATTAGVILAMNPTAFALFSLVFLSVSLLTRFVSLGSLAAVMVVFFYILFFQVVEMAMLYFLIAVLVVVRHRTNLNRLVAGTENRLNLKKNG